MNPTPEQVAAWAREAGCYVFEGEVSMTVYGLVRFATRAMAEQAEQDARTVSLLREKDPDLKRLEHMAWDRAISNAEAAIRANAPKVTT